MFDGMRPIARATMRQNMCSWDVARDIEIDVLVVTIFVKL